MVETCGSSPVRMPNGIDMAKHTSASAAHMWCHLLESPLILAPAALKLSMSNQTRTVCPCLSFLSAQYNTIICLLAMLDTGYRDKRFETYLNKPSSLWSGF